MAITVIEGFQRNYLSHAKNVTGFDTPSAWPPTRSFAIFPNGFWVLYNETSDDRLVADAVIAANDRLRAAGAKFGVTDTAPGVKDVVRYPNYAAWANPPEAIYGSALPKLRELQKKFDPNGVMKLAGGFKI